MVRLRNHENTQLSCCNERGSAAKQQIKNSQTDLDVFTRNAVNHRRSFLESFKALSGIRVGTNCGVIHNRGKRKNH